MSKGPGSVETKIADLLSATRDRALGIDDIARAAFDLANALPTRVQRLSATRALHRLLRRVRETYARIEKSTDQAEREKLFAYCDRVGYWLRFVPVEGKRGHFRSEADPWCVTTIKGRLYVHPPDVPLRVWAVSIGPGGITWAPAEVVRVTADNVLVHYDGATARLNRKSLWHWWAFWRGVRFVSSQSGRIAAELDQEWLRRYGAAGAAPPSSMQMPMAKAMALLGLSGDYTKDDVLRAFRRAVKRAHPDVGGTAEMFTALVAARDRLLSAIGEQAPPPKPPAYAPSGARIVYRRSIGSTAARSRLGSTPRLA
jgi:hypothetical protein